MAETQSNSPRKGLLLVTMEPPAGLEEEFNDWYDHEHLPQRMRMPGFETGARFVCLEGWPRWLALYDLTSLAALSTPEYLSVSLANASPWSRRIAARTVGRSRVEAEQIAPGGAILSPLDSCRGSSSRTIHVGWTTSWPPMQSMPRPARHACRVSCRFACFARSH